MPSVSKKPAGDALVAAKATPPIIAAQPKAGFARAAKPAAQEPVVTAKDAGAEQRTLVAAAPEAKKPEGKRQRLSKAFSRPLDKALRKATLVRERFTLPETEYEQLALLKKRLSARGASAKKSELVRAGLLLIAALPDDELLAVLARLPPLAA